MQNEQSYLREEGYGTWRDRPDEAVRRSETKYRRLHQSMMDAFVTVDMDGHIQEYNDAYRLMLGYEAVELTTLCYRDLTPEKWHAFEAEIVQQQILPKGYSDSYEKEYRRKDGTVFPVEVRTLLIRDEQNQPSAMWAIVRDITERKRRDQRIAKLTQLLRQSAHRAVARGGPAFRLSRLGRLSATPWRAARRRIDPLRVRCRCL
jgi:PAS domain S-box-containing protein